MVHARALHEAFFKVNYNAKLIIKVNPVHVVFNPLSPSIHIQILQTDLHTFPLRIS